jgi:hypothetical protein
MTAMLHRAAHQPAQHRRLIALARHDLARLLNKRQLQRAVAGTEATSPRFADRAIASRRPFAAGASAGKLRLGRDDDRL